ncbi:MAG: CPBP family intramembrane metalloprotease [Aureispira sp.]|nr:CPBP family intramembrane metalloprotease [Aureispira sp.]
MKKTVYPSLLIAISFLAYQKAKYFWAYVIFGAETWNAMDSIYSSSIILLTGISIALICNKLLYGNTSVANLGLKGNVLKGLVTGFVLCLPMILGYAYFFEWNSELTLQLVYRDLVLAGFGEEFIFRGFLFGFLFYHAKWGFFPANLLPALFFGLGHLYQANNSSEAFFIFLLMALASAGFAWFYFAWNSLWPVIFLHGFMDLTWTMFSIDTNVIGNNPINIFRIITLLLAVVWSIKVATDEGRENLLKKMWINRSYAKSEKSED